MIGGGGGGGGTPDSDTNKLHNIYSKVKEISFCRGTKILNIILVIDETVQGGGNMLRWFLRQCKSCYLGIVL